MANSAKSKGDRAELEVQALIRDLTGWPARRKLGAGRLDDCGDIDRVPDTCVQVKAYDDVNRAIREILHELPQQQANAETTFAMGFFRRPGGRYGVIMTPEQALTLLREATRP